MLRSTRHRSNHATASGSLAGRAPARRPGGPDEAAPVVEGQEKSPTSGARPLRGTAARRPGQHGARRNAARSGYAGRQRANLGAHPAVDTRENERLADYEQSVKAAFDAIVPALKQVSALQHENNFEVRAQLIGKEELGFEFPAELLADAWVGQLDLRRLFAWCVFETYRRYCDDFNANDPLGHSDDQQFDAFLQDCGFHLLDITPCADGRLAHAIRYVLRLPQRAVRRKSFAGATFDVEDSLQKWAEVEMRRYREAVPNDAHEPTRYLKSVVYHYSSVDPHHQGCAAHGSDDAKAAQAGLDGLNAFREAVENSYCCGASIDLLLIGMDTDTDAIRVHVPDDQGDIDLSRYIDALDVYKQTQHARADEVEQVIVGLIGQVSGGCADGMSRFIARLLNNNLSQIDYVRRYHGETYPDIGHAERFVGAGIGFEEVQLRNLMYFAYLSTVEEASFDTDVGVKIFTGLNISRGLPVPVVVRFDYHGHVPGARQRAVERCARVAKALDSRYAEIAKTGLLHSVQMVRDCDGDGAIEWLKSSTDVEKPGGH